MQGYLTSQVFEKHCVNAWDDDRNAWRSCFSDEHYFATVLATQGVDEVSSPPARTKHDRSCCTALTHFMIIDAAAVILLLPLSACKALQACKTNSWFLTAKGCCGVRTAQVTSSATVL